MQRIRRNRGVVVALAWTLLAGFLAGGYPVHGFGSPVPWPDDDADGSAWIGAPPALAPHFLHGPVDSETHVDCRPADATRILDAGERHPPTSRGPPSHS